MTNTHQLAVEIVREFSKLSYNASTWEKMIARSTLKPYGCLLDALRIPCPIDRRDEVAFNAARALDREFPIYKNSATLWAAKQWGEKEFRKCVEVVEAAALSTLAQPLEVDDGAIACACPAMSSEPASFVPWHPFRFCTCRPLFPGLYLFANFSAEPELIVDPLAERVIYIGISAGDTVASRLRAFRKSALGSTGHSAGYSYRTEYYADSWSKLNRFEKIYVSWCSLANPRPVEQRLLQDYRNKWGQWPTLNRTS